MVRPALLAAAERQRNVLAHVGDAELFEQFIAPRPALLAVERERFQDREQVLLDGQLAENGLLLRQITHAQPRAPVHRQLGHVLPLKSIRPAFGGTSPTIM